MQTYEFRRLLGLVETLSGERRAHLQLKLAGGDEAHADTVIVGGRMGAQPSCSRCGGDHVVRNGHADGLQRYKRRSCKRTFNALTGMPLARPRQRGKGLTQARALAEGQSVRGVAAQMGVHRTTAFRWRYRFRQLPATVRANDCTSRWGRGR